MAIWVSGQSGHRGGSLCPVPSGHARLWSPEAPVGIAPSAPQLWSVETAPRKGPSLVDILAGFQERRLGLIGWCGWRCWRTGRGRRVGAGVIGTLTHTHRTFPLTLPPTLVAAQNTVPSLTHREEEQQEAERGDRGGDGYEVEKWSRKGGGGSRHPQAGERTSTRVNREMKKSRGKPSNGFGLL